MAVECAGIATVTLFAILLSLFYVYIQRWRTYWKRRNVPALGDGILTGIYKDSMKFNKTLGQVYRQVYEANRDLKYYGTYLFGRPTLVVQDIDMLKEILVKDFSNFNSHGGAPYHSGDPLSGNLFNLDGAKWKSMRGKLSVTFTSGKLKYMFDTMQECVRRFQAVVDKELETKGNVSDMKDKLACLGTDIIASVAFGVEVNSLENPKTEFRENGRRMFTPCLKEFLRGMVLLNVRWLAKLLNLKVINSKSYAFIMQMVKNTVDYREKNNIVRSDFLHMMIQLKNRGYIEVEGKESAFEKDATTGAMNCISIDDVAAQVFVFFAAGFETTSTLTTFVLYELSVHKDIQRKVQEECDRILQETGGKVTYEAVQSMTYTDQVIHETLRFFPAMGAMMRANIRDCTLPLTDVKLDKNTSIWIPVLGLHMDPRWFPDPERFDPERFTEEQKAARPSYVYMPFGEGPRICIGMRFALVQVKSILLGLFSRYNFELTKDSPVPIKLDPRAFITTPCKVDFVISRRKKSS